MAKNNTLAGKREKIKKGDLIFYCAILALPLLNLVVFYFYGNFNSFLLGLKEYDTSTGTFSWEGFSAFAQAFSDLFSKQMGIALKNSLILYVISLFITMPLSLLFSYYIYKRFPFSGIIRVLLYLPSIIASIILIVIFKFFIGRFLPEVIGCEGNLLSNPSTAFPIILLYVVIVGFGGTTLIYSGAMNGINDSVIEAAQLDGCNKLHEFIFIVIPSIWPTLTTYVVTGLAGLFTAQMYLFDIYGQGADANIQNIGYYLYAMTVEGGFSEYPYLSAFGIYLTIVTVPLTFGVRYLMNKFGPSAE